jgi:hypothetical protein
MQPLASPGPTPLLAVAAVVEVAPCKPQVGADLARTGFDGRRRHRVAHDGRSAGPHHVRLLASDALAVRAEVLGVVEVDAGDHRAVGVDRVDGVEPSSESDFQDHGVEPRRRQTAQDRQRGELEIGQREVATSGFHRLEVRQQGCGIDRRAADAAPLLEVHEVRLDVQPDAIPRCQQHRLEHGAGRALAIGAGHGEHRAVECEAEPVAHGLRALQRHVDRARMQTLAVREPVVKGMRHGAPHDSQARIAPRRTRVPGLGRPQSRRLRRRAMKPTPARPASIRA